MGELKRFRIPIIIAAVYCAVYLSLQHNLAVKTATLAEQPITVVIDAGHGGEDGGAVSQDGAKESLINLSIAVRLEQLVALCGMKPMMLRSSEDAVSVDGDTIHARKVADLKKRAELVNGAGPAVLISIHQNHFGESKYYGAQAFYAAADGSKEFAQLVQRALRSALDPGNAREPKPADTVYLMEKVNCTAILVECGFLSNPQEAKLLQTPGYQTKIACAIGSALSQFLEEGKRIEI